MTLKKSLNILDYICKNWEEWDKRQIASANPHIKDSSGDTKGYDYYDVSDFDEFQPIRAMHPKNASTLQMRSIPIGTAGGVHNMSPEYAEEYFEDEPFPAFSVNKPIIPNESDYFNLRYRTPEKAAENYQYELKTINPYRKDYNKKREELENYSVANEGRFEGKPHNAMKWPEPEKTQTPSSSLPKLEDTGKFTF